MKNVIRNFLILSLIVASVPVIAAPKAKHTNKHHHANSESLSKKECDRRYHKQCMRDGWLMVGGILAYPISLALYPFTYRANKRRAEAVRKNAKKIKRKLQKKQKKSASESTSSARS